MQQVSSRPPSASTAAEAGAGSPAPAPATDAQPPAPRPRGVDVRGLGPSTLLHRIGPQNVALLLALILLCLVIRTRSNKIFLLANLLDIGVAVSILGILAVAQMVVVIS